MCVFFFFLILIHLVLSCSFLLFSFLVYLFPALHNSLPWLLGGVDNNNNNNNTKTSLMKLKFSARKAVQDCYQCWKFELKISSDSGVMHFSAIKPRWGGCPPLILRGLRGSPATSALVGLFPRIDHMIESRYLAKCTFALVEDKILIVFRNF